MLRIFWRRIRWLRRTWAKSGAFRAGGGHQPRPPARGRHGRLMDVLEHAMVAIPWRGHTFPAPGSAGHHLTVARCLRRLRLLWFRRESLPMSDVPGVCITRLSASRRAVGKASRQIPRKLPGCCRLPSTAPRPHRESSRPPDINARRGTKWNCPRNCRHGACPLRTTGPRFGSGKARIGDEVPVRRPAKASCCSWPAGCPEQ